jgi:hypothetical protein
MIRGLLSLLVSLVMATQTPPRDPRPGALDPRPGALVSMGSTLRGVVVDEQNRPVPGAIVMLRGGPAPGVATTIADVTGSFVFADLAAGSFRLNVWHSGYPSVEYGQTRPGSSPAMIVLASGVSASVMVRMPRGGVISGRVIDEAGQPAAGAVVLAMPDDRSDEQSGGREVRTMTDGTGRYRRSSHSRLRRAHGLSAAPSSSVTLHRRLQAVPC